MKVIFISLSMMVHVLTPGVLTIDEDVDNHLDDYFKIKDLLGHFKISEDLKEQIAISIYRYRGNLDTRDLSWVICHLFCESSWNPKAIGDKGKSFGLGQVQIPRVRLIMKEAILNYRKEIAQSQLEDQLLVIDFNLWSCLEWLNSLKKKYGNIQHAITFYNAGRFVSLQYSKHYKRVARVHKERFGSL